MNLDPTLSSTDRVGNLALGVGLIAYGLLGNFDNTWVRGFMIAIGVWSAAGGLTGT